MALALRILGQDPPVVPGRHSAWLAYGFRPFFLAGSASAGILLGLWLWLLSGQMPWRPGLDPVLWHAHEMLFGFAAAIVAGFLLTAVPNWTGIPTPKGRWLGILLTVWTLGRLASWLGGAAACLDLTFLPCLAFALVGPLWRKGEVRNLVFLPILAALWLADASFWRGVWQQQAHVSHLGLTAAIYLILLLVSILGGRVIPFFAERAIDGHLPVRRPVLNGFVSAGLLVALGLEFATEMGVGWKSGFVLVLAGAHLWRLWGWSCRALLRIPLLWVLFLAYLFLPVGLALKGFAWMGWGSSSAATHALTAGCIGGMCLGMMARVALGHSGRQLLPAPATVLAFGLILCSGMVRSLIPFLWPSFYVPSLWIAGSLWCLAYALYFAVYWPILTTPRVDGKPG